MRFDQECAVSCRNREAFHFEQQNGLAYSAQSGQEDALFWAPVFDASKEYACLFDDGFAPGEFWRRCPGSWRERIPNRVHYANVC